MKSAVPDTQISTQTLRVCVCFICTGVGSWRNSARQREQSNTSMQIHVKKVLTKRPVSQGLSKLQLVRDSSALL